MPQPKDIRIGNQTAFSAESALAPFAYAVENGFDAFEWFPDKKEDGRGWNDIEIGQELRGWIRQTAAEHDIMLSVHVPWNADPLTSQGRDLLLRNVGFALDLGASLVNIHLTLSEGIERFLDTICPVARLAAENGITVSIENTVETGPDDFSQLFSRIRASRDLPADHIGMCLDIGHANLCSETRNDYLGFIDRLDPEVPIIHVHLHENYGDADRHLPVFTGPSAHDASGISGVVRRLLKRHYKGAIILEQWPSPPELLSQARQRLAGLIEGEKKKIEEEEHGRGGSRPDGDGEEFLRALTAAHSTARSWREKLKWVRTALAGTVSEADLAYLSVYLKLLSLGILGVRDDGGHHRPNHLAHIALEIDTRLRELSGEIDPLIVRKIRPYLPSGDPAYRRAEPLTRIRDIAHRNDIPKDLKLEIKRSLQNKLHRCAGPEDLLTSSRLLSRIMERPEDYSAAFVAEFKIFHEELEEFFNAHGLEKRLLKIIPLLPEAAADVTRQLLAAKRRGPDAQEILGLLTDVRQRIAAERHGSEGPEAQQFFLADTGLEDYASSLLNGIATETDRLQWGSPHWARTVSTLSLGLRNLGMSSVEPDECAAMVNEIGALYGLVNLRDRDQLLMIYALCGRLLRLTETHRDRMIGLFARRAERLGRALGVNEEDLRYFIENDLREHIVFPLSRLAVSLSRQVRRVLQLSPWDPVVTGLCEGRLACVCRIGEAPSSSEEDAWILLVERVEGDEDIPAGVTGIIVAHQLPHLCHFCVRARQRGTVVAVCEDPARTSEMLETTGEKVQMHVTAEGVRIIKPERDGVKISPDGGGKRHDPTAVTVDLSADPALYDLDGITVERGGGKAHAIKRLRDLSRVPDAGFVVPEGVVIPFGVMRRALAADPDIRRRYARLAGDLASRGDNEIEHVCDEIRSLVGMIRVPHEVLDGIWRRFGRHAPLIVRSSGSDEDGRFGAAGTYSSMAGVRGTEVEGAILAVWASLWSFMATARRRVRGLPLDGSHMAVLVQPLLAPDISFVVHTVNPLNKNRSELYAELCHGHGEIICSPVYKGSPYRMVCDKFTRTFRMTAFANFSVLLDAGEDAIVARVADYSHLRLHRDPAFRSAVAGRLTAIGLKVEETFAGPQDIEGGFVGEVAHLFQSRPQQGL